MTHHSLSLRIRPVSPRIVHRLQAAGIDPLLARLYAARGATDPAQCRHDLAALLPPAAMKGINTAAALIADAVMAKARIVVVGDYDCDGATATALAVRALSAMGGDVAYLIPNRFTDGYGLSPRIVELAAERFAPQLLITVDNGIASHSGVAAAHQRNIRVVITDHHLPGETLPAADALVNPNQPDCPFPSKAIAGVGVLFYVMMAVRAELRRRGWFTKERPEPNLAQWLDLVALGTVADVVPLDHNNRILVAQGLARIRAGRASPGLIALFQAARRDPRFANSQDLGFFIAPRLNAAGRLQAMTLGVACLLADSLANALPLAQQLDAINRERQAIETRMRDEALVLTDGMAIGEQQTLVLFHPGWHQGVIGLVASRLKERYGRPVFAFAPHEDGLIKGSGRSVTGLHLRDALDLVSKWEPTLLIAFGGHAMAAGVMLREADLPRFTALFEEAVARLAPDGLNPNILETDGSLPLSEATLSTAERLQDVVWGQGFPAPLFLDTFALLEQRLVGGGHLQLRLCRNDGDRQAAFAAIRFRQTEPFPPSFTGAYQLTIDRYQGEPRLRLLLEGIAPAISGDAINLG